MRGRGRGLLKLPTLQTQLHAHTEVVVGVISGILLSIQVEDPVSTAGGEAVSIRCCDDGLNYTCR